MALSAACKVYVAFSSGPLVASPTWTEVTSYVRSVQTSRGRGSELDDFQAGSATIVLSNADRRFDPDHAAGPYYGNLLPRRQVKIEAVVGGVTYPVFRGVTQSFEQGYPMLGKDAICTLRCADLLSLFATWDLPRDAHASVVEPLAPTLWWSLGDDGTALDNAGRYPAVYSEDRQSVAPLIPGGDGASRLDITAAYTSSTIVPRRLLLPGSSPSYTVSFYMRASTSARIVYLFQSNVLAGNQAAYIDINKGLIEFYQSGGSLPGQNATATGSVPVADGNVHHVACVRNGDTLTVYIDGVSDGTATASTAMTSMNPTYMTLGEVSTVGYLEVDEFTIFYGTALTAGQIATLGAARRGWSDDLVGARLQSLCDILGVPAGLVSFGTSSSSLGAYSGDSDAFSVAAEAARSDQGRLFVSKSGVLTFQPKTTDMGASSAVTFADDSTANAVRYSGFGLELDERLIYNLVTVTGVNDEFTARDSTSQSTYSKRSLTVDTTLPSAAACRDVAQRLIARYASPATRGRSWVVHPERQLIGSTTLAWASVLNRELGDIVTLKRTPPTGSAITKTVQLTSIGHDIDIPSGNWTVTFAGAPAYTTASFRWGTSNWDGTDGWS